MHVSESCEFVSCYLSLHSKGGGFLLEGEILGNPLWGEKLSFRIFSPPEEISRGRFCPVTLG